jgi:hypothetical protein
MTDKWRWILLLWHAWRAAVWRAEMCLYPIEHHSGNLRSVPYRHQHAEAMYDYHEACRNEFHRQLFPQPTISVEEAIQRYARQGKQSKTRT